MAPEPWLASMFAGADVLGSDSEKIGEVSDILFGKDGSDRPLMTRPEGRVCMHCMRCTTRSVARAARFAFPQLCVYVMHRRGDQY